LYTGAPEYDTALTGLALEQSCRDQKQNSEAKSDKSEGISRAHGKDSNGTANHQYTK
jgi:hypothetical protein